MVKEPLWRFTCLCRHVNGKKMKCEVLDPVQLRKGYGRPNVFHLRLGRHLKVRQKIVLEMFSNSKQIETRPRTYHAWEVVVWAAHLTTPIAHQWLAGLSLKGNGRNFRRTARCWFNNMIGMLRH
eukprot:4294243-Amphidinium_carterae.1